MNYEGLLIEAEKEGLITKEKPLKAYWGRIKGNKIAIAKNIPTVTKCCVMAEELGHYYTTAGDILDQTNVNNVKQELKARIWAYDKLIGLNGLILCFESGCRNIYECAQKLDVTEDFFSDALKAYTSKYGTCVKLRDYWIMFEPALNIIKLL